MNSQCRRRCFQRSILLLAVTGTCFLTGCGGREIPEGTYGQENGRLTLSGKPVPDGTTVVLLHKSKGYTATGTVLDDGYYTASFRGGLDLLTGMYAVSVSPPAEQTPESNPDSPEAYARMMEAGPEKEGKSDSAFPEKYTSANTSNEVMEVKEGSNEYNLDMKAD